MKDYLDKIPSAPEHFPKHIDPKTGRFRPGHSGNPAGRPKNVLNQTTLIKETLLSFFENNYINSGKFMRWVSLPGNERAFFDYVIKHVMAKDINMQVEAQSSLADELQRARSRRASLS
jgi:hypothetical protein